MRAICVSAASVLGFVALVASPGLRALGAQLEKAPESFRVNANVVSGGGAAASTFLVQIDQYTPDKEREAVVEALKTGGYASFLTTLRKTPVAGHVTMKDKSWPIRWARQQAAPKGRVIVVVTDQPVFFVGGGSVDAKPREGYDVALLQLEVDPSGFGSGTMAAAARIKAGEPTGVQVDDYADKPIKLVTVTRVIK